MNETIYKEVINICKHITKGDDLHQDLAQEVSIVLLGVEDLEIKWSESRSYIVSYIYGTAYKMWNLKNTKFFRENKKNKLYEVTDVNEELSTCESLDNISIEDIMIELSEIEALWLKHYISRNCSLKKLAEDVNINRNSVTERIEYIKEKAKWITKKKY